jgi:hypothetical protein
MDTGTTPQLTTQDTLLTPGPERAPEINLHRRAIVGVLAATIGTLTLLSLAGQFSRFFLGHPTVYGLVPLFYVDLENSVPTWYQSVALLFAALLLAANGLADRSAGKTFAGHWLALAVIAALLSVDEIAGLHERVIEPMQRIIGRPTGMWAPTWIFIGLALVAVVSLVFLPFYMRLERHLQLRLAAAAALFVAGGVGVEMASAAQGGDKATLAYALLAHLEEFLEMTGVLVLIDALLRRLDGGPALTLRVCR